MKAKSKWQKLCKGCWKTGHLALKKKQNLKDEKLTLQSLYFKG